MTNLEEIIGASPESLSNSFYAEQPSWVQGSLSHSDARFLFKKVLTVRTNLIVELGTACGFSTSLLCYASDVANRAGLVSSDFRVVTYDINTMWHRDPTKKIGDATREQLNEELLNHIVYRNPATALDIVRDFGKDQVEFLFIDANHQHPWAALDLLVILDCLKPGATVIFHDINLPLIHPQFADWGAKYLFDDLTLEKDVPTDVEIPNIGSVIIPEDKERLKAQLLKILFGHEWQTNISQDYLEKAGVVRENA